MSEPATKHDLADLRSEMHGLRDDLRGEMHDLRNDLRGDMHGMEKRLSWEIAHGINAVAEMLRDHVGVVDEKYADLPERVRRLEEHDRDQQE